MHYWDLMNSIFKNMLDKRPPNAAVKRDAALNRAHFGICCAAPLNLLGYTSNKLIVPAIIQAWISSTITHLNY